MKMPLDSASYFQWESTEKLCMDVKTKKWLLKQTTYKNVKVYGFLLPIT